VCVLYGEMCNYFNLKLDQNALGGRVLLGTEKKDGSLIFPFGPL